MIRPARPDDLQEILSVYAVARTFMAKHGNPTQWGNTYPARELLEEDIRQGQLYVDEENGAIDGVFAYIPGEDPTYQIIDGAWISDTPYAAIHRVAGSGRRKGTLNRCLAYCRERTPHIRIDTHPDNKVMQHLLTKAGFTYCGVIWVEDGTIRWAYEMI